MSTWQPRKEFLTDIQRVQFNLAEPTPPLLIHWLSKLSLLYGIPFQYLVPDERILPIESIRFFHIDENWINNLIDGAMSIGRVISSDFEHDNTFLLKIMDEIRQELPKIRQSLLKKTYNGISSSEVKTGFLLRSAIVEGWPGLEVKAYTTTEDETNFLTILRMERLAKDVLLCIFDGEFQEVEIREPAETMHFGANLESCKFTKMLRGLGVKEVGLGVEISDVIVDVPTKESSRTLDVLKTVENIKNALQKKGELGEYFSSAEFAVEMVESAQMGVFRNEF